MQPRVNQLKIGVVLSYISKVIQIVVGLLYTPIMIRLLGQNEYGLYNIATSVIAYLGILNFGFSSAYMRFYSRYKIEDEKNKIATLNGMFLLIFSALGIIAIIAGIIVTVNVDVMFGKTLLKEEIITAQILMLILVINLGVSFPVIVFNTYIQANEKFIFQNTLQILRQVSTPLISLPLLLTGYGSIGMVIGTVTVNVIVEIITVYYTLKKMNISFSFKEFDKPLMKEMTIYSSFIFINMVVDQINNNVDKTILGRYSGTIPVAIYSVATTLNSYYIQISTGISNVFIPRVHRMVSANVDNIELTKLFSRIGRIQFILLSVILSGFIFFGRPFIGIWAGEDYFTSYITALILMIPITIPLIQNIGIEFQRAKNMHQFRSYLYLFMAIGNIIISIPLSIKYGAVGAAFGTGLSYVLGNGFVMNWYNHTKIGLDMKYFWKEIAKFIPAFIPPVIYGILINKFVDLYILKNLLINGLVYVAIFVLSMWFLGLNKYEKGLVKSPFK